MKGLYWENVAKNSFQIISRFPHKILVAKAPSEIMREEVAGASLIDVFDSDLTRGFRMFLNEIATGSSGAALTFAKSQIKAVQEGLGKHQLNHNQNRTDLEMIVEQIKSVIRTRGYRKILDPIESELCRMSITFQLASEAVLRSLIQQGVLIGKAQELANRDSCCLRQCIGVYCLSFKWALLGCLPGPPKVTNEVMDSDQALIGTYCDEILTTELSVSLLRDEILQVLSSNVACALP